MGTSPLSRTCLASVWVSKHSRQFWDYTEKDGFGEFVFRCKSTMRCGAMWVTLGSAPLKKLSAPTAFSLWCFEHAAGEACLGRCATSRPCLRVLVLLKCFCTWPAEWRDVSPVPVELGRRLFWTVLGPVWTPLQCRIRFFLSIYSFIHLSFVHFQQRTPCLLCSRHCVRLWKHRLEQTQTSSPRQDTLSTERPPAQCRVTSGQWQDR